MVLVRAMGAIFIIVILGKRKQIQYDTAYNDKNSNDYGECDFHYPLRLASLNDKITKSLHPNGIFFDLFGLNLDLCACIPRPTITYGN